MATLDTLHYRLEARDSSKSCTRVTSEHNSRGYARGTAVITDSMLSVLMEAEQASTLEENRDCARRLAAMMADNWELRHPEGN